MEQRKDIWQVSLDGRRRNQKINKHRRRRERLTKTKNDKNAKIAKYQKPKPKIGEKSFT